MRANGSFPGVVTAAAALLALAGSCAATPVPPPGEASRGSARQAVSPPGKGSPAPDRTSADGVRTPDRASYEISLRSGTTGQRWKGTERITFTNTARTPLRRVWVRLWGNGFGKCNNQPAKNATRVSHVTGGTAGELTVDCTALPVTLPEPLAEGERHTIAFDVAIEAPERIDQFGHNGPYNYFGNALPHLAVRDGQGWHLNPDPKAGEGYYHLISDYRVRLTHPSDIAVPASGKERTEPARDNWSTTTAVARSVRDFTWAAGPFENSSITTPAGVTVQTWWGSGTFDEQSAKLQRVAAQSMAAHAERLGAYPRDEIDMVIDDKLSSGMEYPGLIQVDIDPDANTVIHEVAHQWFYGIVGNNEWASPWLDESFATYLTNLYLGKRGNGCWTGEWPAKDAAITNDMAYWDEHEESYFPVVYDMGSCALHDLRRVLGEDGMSELLRTYAHDNWFGMATTAEFKAAAQRVASELPEPVDLEKFWKRHRIRG